MALRSLVRKLLDLLAGALWFLGRKIDDAWSKGKIVCARHDPNRHY